jgi:hypothetical protein
MTESIRKNSRRHPTLGFSRGARSAFKLKEKAYLRSTRSRRQLQAIVMPPFDEAILLLPL